MQQTRCQNLLSVSTEELHNNYRLCAKHFEECMFMNESKKKLVWDAIPSLFDVPNNPPKFAQKRKLPIRHHTTKPSVKKSKIDEASEPAGGK